VEPIRFRGVIATSICEGVIGGLDIVELEAVRHHGAEVHASGHHYKASIAAGRGLVLEKPDPSSPFHSASEGVDKSAVVRHALSVADSVAFAGDGSPDLQPALLVRPRLRFARGFLAEALRTRGEGFQPFSRWSEIARVLA
jgi:hypothetical protein